MTEGQKYEYEIALKIYNYDLSIIEKEIEHLTTCLEKYDDSYYTYCNKRMEQLLPLREKKIKQITDLKEKYKA
jgi:hypothetical protein